MDETHLALDAAMDVCHANRHRGGSIDIGRYLATFEADRVSEVGFALSAASQSRRFVPPLRAFRSSYQLRTSQVGTTSSEMCAKKATFENARHN